MQLVNFLMYLWIQLYTVLFYRKGYHVCMREREGAIEREGRYKEREREREREMEIGMFFGLFHLIRS